MAARRMRLLVSGAGEPAWNLALDEALLHGGGSAVRFYSWAPPGLSLGYFQELTELAGEVARCEREGFRVVRRPTGGGAIAHFGELTFCIADDRGAGIFDADVRTGYRRIHRVFSRALLRLGVRADERGAAPLTSDRDGAAWLCFCSSSDLDLVASGRKLLGSAERRIGTRVMHHGSLPLLPNPITPVAASVREELGRDVPFEEMVGVLVPEFESEFGLLLQPGDPTSEEIAIAERLVTEKYGHSSWTGRR